MFGAVSPGCPHSGAFRSPRAVVSLAGNSLAFPTQQHLEASCLWGWGLAGVVKGPRAPLPARAGLWFF